MTLLDAPPFDPRRERRRKLAAIVAAVLVLVAIVAVLYWPRYSARHAVTRFFAAIERKNYQEAYYIWQANPKLYSMDAFMKDWGPNSRWGAIQTYSIEQLGPPAGGHASGLVAIVRINGIASDEARLWIQNGTHELGFYPY